MDTADCRRFSTPSNAIKAADCCFMPCETRCKASSGTRTISHVRPPGAAEIIHNLRIRLGARYLRFGRSTQHGSGQHISRSCHSAAAKLNTLHCYEYHNNTEQPLRNLWERHDPSLPSDVDGMQHIALFFATQPCVPKNCTMPQSRQGENNWRHFSR